MLQNDAHRLRVSVNEHVAHDMAEPTLAGMPTYADLDAAIDSVPTGRVHGLDVRQSVPRK
jgi:hypothetical protein